jgi:DNA replication and repair protein RecF
MQLSASNIFSPEQIDFLMYSSAKRRDFMDRLICKIDSDYKGNLQTFEKVLRQRNAYLKRMSKAFYESGIINHQDSQLHYWTNELAHYSGKLMSKRAQILNQLADRESKIRINYKPAITLNLFEDLAQTEELIEITLRQLQNELKRDIALGHTHTGAHRDDWRIQTDKDIKRFGSRGEKRTALGKLIFSTQELYLENLGYYPILLLDDIASELDDHNLFKLVTHASLNNQQVIITTINRSADIQSWLKNRAKMIKLDENI